MITLVLALYAEGPSDNRFLPPIIQRTAERLIAQYGQRTVDVLEPMIVPRQKGLSCDIGILNAARHACGYHALVVHADADDETPYSAKTHRIHPGFKLVLDSNEQVCKDLVPIIPVQTVEAWMLADYQALRETIGTDMSSQNLGLPARPALVEAVANPKRTLEEVISRAFANHPQRRRRPDFSTRQEALARRINLDTLASVPSYMEFVNELRNILTVLNFI
ncbi:MAG TPA: DUF4276 family protein [Ktedonosporobacter sp.]|jgi:hypothetical protein|nr:DUF4276 family protein [Ktedonosporobacter sp.]